MDSSNRPANRPLSRIEVLRALRTSNLEAIAATVHASLTGGAFQTGFALFLGAGSFAMGVVGAIPTITALVQLASSLWVEKLGERKRLTAWASLIARSLWLPILLIPWFLPREWWLGAFLVLFAASSVALQIPVPAFTSWLSDLVPPDHRGRYFGRRNMLAGVTTIAATVPPAWLLDKATGDWGVPRQSGFAALFAVAVVFGIISFFLLLRQPEPPMASDPEVRDKGFRQLLSLYRRPLGDRTFRPFLVFSVVFAVGQFFAAPFYTVYALQDLNLGYTWLQVLGSVASLSALVTMPLWGYLADRFGNKPLLTISLVGITLGPLPWLACTAENRTAALVILIFSNLFGGVVWAGAGLLGFNMLIETSPSEGRSLYVGALSAASGIAGGVAPVLGGLALEFYQALPMERLGITLNGYHALFLANALIRLLTLPLIRAVPTPARASTKQVLGQLGSVRLRTLKQMRQLQHGTSEQERTQAAEALSEDRAGLAVQELVLALGDPSLRVRRSAARALRDIGDPAAAPSLIAVLLQPESGIVREAAEALGRIGSPEAVAPLCQVAVSGPRVARLSAVEALGQIGSPEAGPCLLEALEEALTHGWEDVAEAALQSIGQCQVTEASPRLLELLDTADGPILIAVVRALGDLGSSEAGPALVRVLERAEGSPLIIAACVALAQCGYADAAPEMYAALSRVDSTTARRQIANAIGSLLGDEQIYRLLTADVLTREEAISRAIQALGRGSKKLSRSAQTRRRLLAERAEKCYAEGDLMGAAHLLSRLVSNGKGPAAAVLDLARHRLRERSPTEEEFLVILSSASVLSRGTRERTA